MSVARRQSANPAGGDEPRLPLPSSDPVADPVADPERDPIAEERGADEVNEDLLLRFQLGERAAFDRIVGRYQAQLVRFFYRLCWDTDRAEDFAQDVFLKLLRGAHRYEPQGKLSTFLFRIATNRWIDHYRSRKPGPRLYSLDRADLDDERPMLDRLPADAEEPEADLEVDEQKRQLREALQELTLPHRLVFELAVYQELPYQEIGELLSIPVGTVKSRMHNAAKALKARLARRVAADGPGGGEAGDAASFRAGRACGA